MSMKRLYQILSLAPAPMFLIGLVWNLTSPPAVCGIGNYEMAVMWAVMALTQPTIPNNRYQVNLSDSQDTIQGHVTVYSPWVQIKLQYLGLG
jgi:hypothetical protein